MLEFLSPYFDPIETKVLLTHRLPKRFSRADLSEGLLPFFPGGDIVLTQSGEQAIRLTVQLAQQALKLGQPTIAIPTVMCGSVYRAVKDLGRVILMDCDQSWNCVDDEASRQADILLFAGLGGKRREVPQPANPHQIIIDDACQCYDGISGFRPETDFSIFSFGKGKQMYAGGGGVIYSARHDLQPIKSVIGQPVPAWQLFLMNSQLSKIETINRRRRENGLYYLEHLAGIDWLRLPDPTNHVFLKFNIFIDQGDIRLWEVTRTPEIMNFFRWMAFNKIEVEDTYWPLHVRFPDELNEPRYKMFEANRLWVQALTLPCHPNMNRQDLERVVKAVRNYKPISRPQHKGRNLSASHNRNVYESYYTPEQLKAPAAETYFGNLYQTRLELVRAWGKGKRIIDLGTGAGAYLIPLKQEGFNIAGVDFSGAMLQAATKAGSHQGQASAQAHLYLADLARLPLQDQSYNLAISFSTLYYLPNIAEALAEISRILPDQGMALLEFGNLHSLNTIEAKRAATGVQSYHVPAETVYSLAAATGFQLVDSRAFQFFPLYGGGTPHDQRLNTLLAEALKQQRNGVMLDELVSSNPCLRNFAFRHLLILQKNRGEARLSQPFAPLTAGQLAGYDDENRAALRQQARDLWARGDREAGLRLLLAQLFEDPTDFLTVLAIADLYEGPEERAFVKEIRRLLAPTPVVRPQINPTPLAAPHERMKANKPMPSTPKVSIVLPTYNHLAFLPVALKSVLAQTFQDYELIIVNDGSTDGTAEFLDQLKDSRIRVIHQENKHLPEALNTGFRAARGQFFTWISADNYCAPFFLEALVAALETFPAAGLAYSAFAWVDEQDQIVQITRDQELTYRRLVPSNPGLAAFMYRRICHEQVGWYDPGLEGAEDWDMWLRILENFQAVYVPELLYYYRQHPHSMTAQIPDKVRRASEQVFLKTLARNHHQFELAVLYPSLSLCQKEKLGQFHAAFDFGTLLLASPFAPPSTAAAMLETALALAPQAAQVKHNLAVAYARSGQWAKALNLLPDLGQMVHPLAESTCHRIEEAHRQNNPALLANQALFTLDKTASELLQLEQQRLLTFSLTQSYPSSPPMPAPAHGLAQANGAGGQNIAVEPDKLPQVAPLVGQAGAYFASGEPVVSVIVPTYHRPNMLAKALHSILNQTYQNFEIIVVNDAGVEVEPLITALNQQRNKITYIKHGVNRGLAAARNTGIKVARGKYIAYLDDDDIFYPQHLETLLKALEPGRYRAAYTDAYRAFQELINGEYVVTRKDVPFSADFDPDGILVKNLFPVLCLMHEKSCLANVGLFDETLTTHEDWDLWIRMSREYELLHLKELTCEFSWRQDGSTMTGERRADFLRTAEIIYANYRTYATSKPTVLAAQESFLQHLRQEVYGEMAGVSAPPKEVLPTEKAPAQVQVSIIIPVFNKVTLTQQCLESLYRHTAPQADFEVLIIDNASVDGTQAYLQQASRQYPRLRVLTNVENVGYARASNQGAQAALGEYLLFLNNDTQVQPGWLESLLRIIKADPGVGAVGSKLLFPNGTIQHAGVIISDDQKAAEPVAAMHIYAGLPATFPEANDLRCYQALTAACILVRKSAFHQADGFDEGYWNGYEDVDLCFKLQAHGWQLVYQPESVVIHYESQSGPQRFIKVRENVARLRARWAGKIQPDFTIAPNGVASYTGAGRVRAYALPSPERISPLTSIIILTHNQLNDTRLCLDALALYTPQPHELIIIDNGSTDGTLTYLQQYAAAHKNVRVIANPDNRGYAAANNQGLALAQGHYVVLLNNDTVVTHGWLARLLAVFERRPEAGLVGPVSNHVSGPQRVQNVSYGNLDEMRQFAATWTSNHAGQIIEFPRLVGFCLMVRREVIERIGGLDEQFGSGNFEDDDYCLRAGQAGFKLYIAQDVFIHHTGGQTFQGAGIDYQQSMEHNWKLFKAKWQLPAHLTCGENYLPYLAAAPTHPFMPLLARAGAETTLDQAEPGHSDATRMAEFIKIQSQVETAQRQREWPLAIELLNSALQTAQVPGTFSPEKSVSLWNSLGYSYVMNGDPVAAERAFCEGLKLAPRHLDLLSNLADLYLQQEQFDRATEYLNRALTINPNDVNVLLSLGNCCIQLGVLDTALMTFQRVQMLAPDTAGIDEVVQQLEGIAVNELAG